MAVGATLRWGAIAAVVVLALAGVAWWASDRTAQAEASWLFSHTASGGTLQQNADGSYTLTLTDIDPHVIAFTDRPVRDSQIMDAADLVRNWPGYFADSPPNAVLVEHSPSGVSDSVVLTISQPQLITSPDGASSSVTFRGDLITDEHPEALKRIAGTLHTTPPATFNDASLFIDDITSISVGTATFEVWECNSLYGTTMESFQMPADQARFDAMSASCAEADGVMEQMGR